MSEQESTAAESGVEQTSTPETEVEQEIKLDDQGNPVEAEELEITEIDFGGNKKALPAGTPREVAQQVQEFAKSLWADYTKNNQKAVESAKQFEAREAEARSVFEFRQAVIDDVAEFKNVEKQLSQYKDVDWNTARLAVDAIADPTQKQQAAMQLAQASMAYNQLINRKNELTGTLQTKEAQFREYMRQKTDESLGQIGKRIPDWSETKRNELRAYALNDLGVSTAGFAQITDPALVEAIHKAKLFDEMQRKAKVAATPKQTQPVTPVKSNASTASRDPERMSPEEWLKWRTQQVNAKRNLKQYQRR